MELNGDRETWDDWRPEHSESTPRARWLDSLGEESARASKNDENFFATCNGSRTSNGARSKPTPKRRASR